MKLVLVFLIFVVQLAHSEEKIEGGFTHRLNMSLGTTGLSLSEQTSSPGSYSGTAINLNVEYPFLQVIKREYFLRSSVPVATQAGAGLYSLTVGLNSYSAKLSAPYQLEDGATQLKIRPKMQYYWGPHLGGGAAVYKIGSAKKSDFGFLIGGQAGLIKPLAAPWGIKGEGGLSKGFGINSSFLSYFLSGGVTYDLD